jgi:hypothetical protein
MARACPSIACIALFFTGRQHAGENIADVLKRRAAALPAPGQRCEASSSNPSAYPEGVKILVANCLAHGRRQCVEVMANFPTEGRLVLEKLGSVYHNDALARRGQLSADERGPRWVGPCAAEWKTSRPAADGGASIQSGSQAVSCWRQQV